MKTLEEDIDDLDRMVDTDAQKDAIRSQIRLVAREVAALEAAYAGLAQRHAQLEEAHAQLQQAHAKALEESKQRGIDAWNEAARRSRDIESNYLESE